MQGNDLDTLTRINTQPFDRGVDTFPLNLMDLVIPPPSIGSKAVTCKLDYSPKPTSTSP